jgi:hypothetical protein
MSHHMALVGLGILKKSYAKSFKKFQIISQALKHLEQRSFYQTVSQTSTT